MCFNISGVRLIDFTWGTACESARLYERKRFWHVNSWPASSQVWQSCRCISWWCGRPCKRLYSLRFLSSVCRAKSVISPSSVGSEARGVSLGREWAGCLCDFQGRGCGRPTWLTSWHRCFSIVLWTCSWPWAGWASPVSFTLCSGGMQRRLKVHLGFHYFLVWLRCGRN